ncbi:MAG: hypothetical protein AB7Q42_21925 [Acidimicrobiia bacterium]
MFNRDQAERIFIKLQVNPLYADNTVLGWVYLDGKKERLLRYSNGNFEMSSALESAMCAALRLEQHEFVRLHECHLSQESYLEILRSRS